MRSDQAQRLMTRCGVSGEGLDDTVVDRINAFISLRALWARKHNLSGPKALRAPWEMDIVDGVALNAMLDTQLPLVDVGSGSGIPALVVAAIRPEHPIQIVEPLTKRVAFLRVACAQLGLKAVRIERSRWPIEITEPVQVVSRAVISPDAWPALAVSAGENVQIVYRYLAATRPQFGLPDFQLASALDYCPPDRGELRLERWDRA